MWDVIERARPAAPDPESPLDVKRMADDPRDGLEIRDLRAD
jgi:hypothetical protein